MTLKCLKLKQAYLTSEVFELLKKNIHLSSLTEFSVVVGKPGVYRDPDALSANWIEVYIDGELRAFEVHEYQFLARFDILNAFEQSGRTTTDLYREVRKVEVEAKLKWLSMFDKKYFHEYIGHFDLAFLMEPEQLGDFDE